MATPQKGPNFGPKTTNFFVNTFDLTETICDVLRATFGDDKHAAKRLARVADSSPETAKNWLSGRNPPGLKHFLILARQIPELKGLVCRMLELDTDINPTIERDLIALHTHLTKLLSKGPQGNDGI